jgi:hypothetical protein
MTDFFDGKQNMISRRTRNTAVAIICLMAVLLLVAFSMRPLWFRDGHTNDSFSPLAWPVDTLTASDEQWACALACLLDNQSGGATTDLDGGRSPMKYDFHRIHGIWFCAVLSRRDDSTGFYRSIVGWLRAGQIGWRELSNGRRELKDTSISSYLRLITADSLWSLFGEWGFWKDDNWWLTTYDKAGWWLDDSVQMSHLIDLSGCNCFGRSTAHSSAKVISNAPDSSTEVSWLQVSLWLLREVPLGNSKDTTYEFLTPRQELFVHRGRYFTGIFSRRNNQVGAYVAVVGQHLGDSVVYRQVDEVRSLKGNDLTRYLELVKADSLWTLLGLRDLLADESGLERLWSQAGQRRLADSDAVLTRVLRFTGEGRK